MLFEPPPPGSAVVGTGRITLDVVVQGTTLRAQAGGTCGNVLAILAYLGWRAFALGRVGDDDAGRRLARDLARWGVDGSLLEVVDDPTPVVVHHVREGGHSFGGICPLCGGWLPTLQPVPAESLRIERLPPASVFFFDRDSEAALLLARFYRERGATVVWEPNYAGPEVDVAGAMAASDVVKFSAATASGLRSGIDHPFVIETHGERGLTYDRGGTYCHLPASRVAVTRDAAGCGDWATAGFLHARAHGAANEEALRFGMALAAWNAAFVGARGGVYAVDRATFRAQVAAILAGELTDPGEGRESGLDDAGAFCAVCT